MFASLDKAESILSRQRFIAGKRFTEADLRLFVTLIRFDEVRIASFCLWNCATDLPCSTLQQHRAASGQACFLVGFSQLIDLNMLGVW